MNKKYEKYINYIVNDIEPPYFKNMEEQYGLRHEEFEMVLSKLYGQPVVWGDNYESRMSGWSTPTENYIKDKLGRVIYKESNNGTTIFWVKREYDDNDNEIYYENSYGDIIDKR